MSRYSKRLYRVWLPDGRVVDERAIGPSEIPALYPQLVRLELVPELGEFW